MSERLAARSLLRNDPSALRGMPPPSDGPVCGDCAPLGDDSLGIVHIGDDTLARAHLASYAEDLIRAGWPGRIHLILVEGNGTEEHLVAQDCLYSVMTTDADDTDAPRAVRVMASVARVSTGVQAAIEAIASPATVMVTVTTEGSASDEHDEWSAHDEWSDQHDDVMDVGDGDADNSDGGGPGVRVGGTPSIPELIALGLGSRDRSLPPPVVMALDEVFMNGEILRRHVMDAASRIDDELEEWIEIEVEFPNNVVDRMVRRASRDDLDEIESLLGLRDEAALIAERHGSWAIESVEGLPPLADAGAELTRNVIPFERRRLWLIEGPRLALAHAGTFLGLATVADAAAHPTAAGFATRISRAAVAVTLMAAGGEPDGAEVGTTERYAAKALARLGDPTMTLPCVEVCANGSRNVPRSILPVTDGLLIAGLGVHDHALLVASWLVLVTGTRAGNMTLPSVSDPLAGYLYAAFSGGGPGALVDAALAELVVNDLPGFAEQVLEQLLEVTALGVSAFGHDR